MAGLITASGSGNWSSTTPDAPWPGGTKPATGDWVEIPAGVTVTLDENTPTLGAAGISNVAGSNTSVLTVSGTGRTINGNINHSGTATAGFLRVPTGTSVTVLGKVTNTGAGYAIVTAGSGYCDVTNAGGTAIEVSAGRGFSGNSTSNTSTITGGIVHSGNNYAVFQITAGGTIKITGTNETVLNTSAATSQALRCNLGAILCELKVLSASIVSVLYAGSSAGVITWTGVHTYTAGEGCFLLAYSAGTINLGVAAGNPLTITNSGAILMLSVGVGEFVAANFSCELQDGSSQFACLGSAITCTIKDNVAGNIVTGTTIYGVAGSYPTTATTNAAHQAADLAFLNANKDEMIPANDSIRAQYGCDVGTAASGGGRPEFRGANL